MQAKETTLVIMAAGMGSRFGGLKQMTPLGPDGQVLMDYSIYDAVRAGFRHAVIIIKKEIEKDFRALVGSRIEKMIDTTYVFQEKEALPEGFTVPEDRKKPWGTGHALLMAKDAVHTPFAVINADDYYGISAYPLIRAQLLSDEPTCMVGFALENTLSEHGTVSRGVCKVKDGYLRSVTEHTALDRSTDLPMDTTVSMNFWGFTPDIFPRLERDLVTFLQHMQDPKKDEFFLPSVVDAMIQKEGKPVRVLQSLDRWYGVTYPEDADAVRAAIADLTAKGLY